MLGYENLLLDMNEFEVSRTKHPVWAKLPAIMEAFTSYPDAEWVWWLDFDAIIMTPHLGLYEHLLDPEVLKSRLVEGQTLILNDRLRASKDHWGETTPDEVRSQYYRRL